jgi:hypothetical protein
VCVAKVIFINIALAVKTINVIMARIFFIFPSPLKGKKLESSIKLCGIIL